jgi:hypothetical protein
MIRVARQRCGCSDLAIEVIGDALPATSCRDFRLADLTPVKFSLPRICRSLARQLLLLAGVLKTGPGRTSDG